MAWSLSLSESGRPKILVVSASLCTPSTRIASTTPGSLRWVPRVKLWALCSPSNLLNDWTVSQCLVIDCQRKRSNVNCAINTLGTAWQGEGGWDTWHCCGIGISYFPSASIHCVISLNITKLCTVSTSVFFRDRLPGDGPPLSCCPFPITSLRPFMAKPVKYTSPSTLKKTPKYSWRNYLLTRDSEIPVRFPNSTCQFVSAAKCLGVPLLRREEK